jgi:hypothetical protein
MISTIDIAVPACTAIIGSCIRVSGTVAFISINFKKLFGFEAWEFCHLRGGSRMQVAEYPSIKSGEKILVRIIGREPTPTLGWPGRDEDMFRLRLRVAFVSKIDPSS